MKNNKTLRLIFNSIIIPLRKIQLVRKLFPSFEKFHTFTEGIKRFYDSIVRLSIAIVFFALIYFFCLEVYSNKYVLKNIDVSSEIMKRDSIRFAQSNLNPKVILRMQEILDETQTAQYSKINILNSLFEDAVPTQISGVDINQIFFFLKKILGIKNHEIRGFIIKDENKDRNVKLLLHIGDDYTENESIHKDSVVAFLAEKVLMFHSPYELGLYYANHLKIKDSIKIQYIVNYMDELENEALFFQNDRWKEKSLHVSALFNSNIEAV